MCFMGRGSNWSNLQHLLLCHIVRLFLSRVYLQHIILMNSHPWYDCHCNILCTLTEKLHTTYKVAHSCTVRVNCIPHVMWPEYLNLICTYSRHAGYIVLYTFVQTPRIYIEGGLMHEIMCIPTLLVTYTCACAINTVHTQGIDDHYMDITT